MMQPAPQPLFFGPAERGVFGWLHRAASTDRGDFGLVVCPPIGFEEISAHRSLRQLACAAAARGICTLRFDYPGCGNSCDSGGFETWLESVHEAADTVKRATGLPRVALLGVRLGVMLAALAAQQRGDVAGLVAIAPVVSGRAWLRELRLLGDAPRADGGLEAAGFVLDAPACQAIAGLHLCRLTHRPAPRVLIVDRDDVPAGDTWPAALREFGAEVRCERWPGYAAMMVDPQRAQTPQAVVDGVVQALVGWRAAPPAGPVPALVGRATMSCRTAVRESALWLGGSGAKLFGVLTLPASGRAMRAVVMLNAGSVHHIGPGRLWVRLARAWAARGVAVLRLDIAGIGDSPVARDGGANVVYPPHALRDVAEAIGRMQALGTKEVHLVGLCSGAYHAFRAAASGLPIASAVAINPLTFFWKEGMRLNVDLQDADTLQMVERYRRTLWRADTWRRFMRGRLDLETIWRAIAQHTWDGLRRRGKEVARVLHIPTPDDLAAELHAAADHGIRLNFVFASDDPGLRLLELQGGRAVKRLVDQGRISIDLIDDADHTFTREASRERLVSVLEGLLFDPALRPPAATVPELRRAPRAA